MERRDFLKTVGVTSAAATAGAPLAATRGDSHTQRDYYELRRYRLASDADRRMVDAYLRDAALPAYNRHGVEPVGVFEPDASGDADDRTLHVLLRYRALDQIVDLREALASDDAYQQAATDYLTTPQDDPAYDRIENVLTVAFAEHPHLHIPQQTEAGEPRLFELRTYESHNERKARRKVEMFNKHEIALFDSLGFTAVFYSDMLVGDKLPNLTYMLVYDDMEQRNELWETFMDSDGWAELSAMERYKDTVSQVHHWFLRPTEYSQL